MFSLYSSFFGFLIKYWKLERACLHKNGPYFCNKIARNDIKHLRQKFYDNNKNNQDIKMCFYGCNSNKTKHLWKVDHLRNDVYYFLPTRTQKDKTTSLSSAFFWKSWMLRRTGWIMWQNLLSLEMLLKNSVAVITFLKILKIKV